MTTRARSSKPATTRRDHVPDGCPLTVAELRAVELLLDGLTYKQAAAKAGVSSTTLRTQLSSAYARLNVADRTQAVLECVKHGWLRWEGLEQTDRQRTNQLLARLEQAVRNRAEHGLTRVQRDYLQALEDYLTGATGIVNATVAKDRAFQRVLDEAGISLNDHGRSEQRDAGRRA